MTMIVELAPEVEAKLEQKAALLGVTVSALVTTLVEDTDTKENAPEKPYGMEALLLLAAEIRATVPKEESLKAPGDWATNPDKYRFGRAKEKE